MKIVGDERYILSAVMHADERNRAMSDALGRDAYHYHMHVVYVPVVEKEIRWTKRCKDPSLIGTVKERIMQVSMSKKWESQPVFGEDGKPLKTKTGKAVLKQSYSVLQDDFFEHMKAAGYTDVERGERGSSEEHLTVTQFKVMKEQERLADSEGTVLGSKIDLGVHKHFNIEQEDFCFDVGMDDAGVSLLINFKEQMMTEKLRSILKFGAFSTRYKDVFDIYYLCGLVDADKLKHCIDELICSDAGMKGNSIRDIQRRVSNTFQNRTYLNRFKTSRKNWLGVEIETVLNGIMNFLGEL